MADMWGPWAMPIAMQVMMKNDESKKRNAPCFVIYQSLTRL